MTGLAEEVQRTTELGRSRRRRFSPGAPRPSKFGGTKVHLDGCSAGALHFDEDNLDGRRGRKPGQDGLGNLATNFFGYLLTASELPLAVFECLQAKRRVDDVDEQRITRDERARVTVADPATFCAALSASALTAS